MAQMGFQRLSRLLLKREKRDRLFELAFEHISTQVEEPPFVPNIDRLARVPVEARVVYWLWVFKCEISGNGIEVFILNQSGNYSPQVHEALTVVGAQELIRRLEAAIPLAREASAEFTMLPDQTWFDQFTRKPEFPTLQSVDRPKSGEKDVYTLIEPLDDLVAAFIRSNEQVLFEA